MKQVWRWFGPKDYIGVRDVAQTGAQGIVHALHHIPTGGVWELHEIERRQLEISSKVPQGYSLAWEVVESVNVHEEIKFGGPRRDYYIENYIKTIENLGASGLHTLCYNFMPVLDWTRTDLNYTLIDGTKALRFDWVDVLVFDKYILQRTHVDSEYSDVLLEAAEERIQKSNEEYLNHLESVILQGLPGTDDIITLDFFKNSLSNYDGLSREDLQVNLSYFLKAITPVAEKAGVRLCCHPDDPPFNIFGLPRIVSTLDDIEFLLASCNSTHNGLTYCTGSLGANPENNLIEILKKSAERIHFVHLRNVSHEKLGSFYEADHLSGSVPMIEIMELLIGESNRRKIESRVDYEIPYRPDHGHLLEIEQGENLRVPGYSMVGRLRGLSELRGVEMAIKTLMK